MSNPRTTAVWVSHTFADGERLICQAECEGAPYPDVLDQLRVTVLSTYRDALGAAASTWSGDEEDE